MPPQQHIAVGIITCMRPKGLRKILESVAAQDVPEGYALSAVVADNDLTGQNREVVEQVQRDTGLPIHFVEEPVRGIPAARNATVRAVLEHGFDAMIFVDDDEEVTPGWLKALVAMQEESGADVVTGPVLGVLPEGSPAWAVKSGIYDLAPDYARAKRMNVAYTGNTLVKRALLEDLGPSFSMKFRYTGGSDFHYFTMAYRKGYTIIWCPEAVIKEEVPLSRITLGWQLKRGYRSGAGYSISMNELDKCLSTTLRSLRFGVTRIGYGTAQILLSPIGGWRYLIYGLKRIAIGVGSIGGLFGINSQEYKTIHGE